MSLDGKSHLDRTLPRLLNVGHVPLALETELGGELLKGEFGALDAICGDVHAFSSHKTNRSASTKVRPLSADIGKLRSQNANMARRGTIKPGVPWYLNEWMSFLKITRQVDLMKRTGWSKATASQLVNGEQTFSPSILKTASEAFGIEPFELLLPPDRALAMRQFYKGAIKVVETGASTPLYVMDVDPTDRPKTPA